VKILNRREKLFLSLTGTVITAALLYRYAVTPFFESVERTRREIASATGKLKKYRALVGQKASITATAGQGDVQGELRDSLVTVLFELESIARKTGVQIVDIRPGVQKQNNQIIVDIRLEGSLSHYIGFIYEVEHSLMLFSLKRTQLGIKPNIAGLEGNCTIAVPLQVDGGTG
jgi:hypothetical protein